MNMQEYQKNWFSNKKNDPEFIDKRRQQFSEWYAKNKDKRKEYRKQYQEKNKQIINAKRRIKSKERMRRDPQFKLRSYLSNAINRQLAKNYGSKNGLSCIDKLPYTLEKLKEYLECHFESWMTWSNRGKYNSKLWNDNDPSTWTWQIDHIVPHSIFKYSSTNDKEFQDCWALNNLRPVSAKLNILKGAK